MHQKDQNWLFIPISKLKNFFALILQIKIVKLYTLKDYCSTNPIFKRNINASVMALNRFKNIRFLHLADNETTYKTRLYKIDGYVY